MPERDSEPFSNPLAPDGHDVDDPHSFHQSKLTNEDFRKLLMTPRAAPTSAPPSKSRHHEMPREYNEDEDPAARRRLITIRLRSRGALVEIAKNTKKREHWVGSSAPAPNILMK